MRDVEMFSAMTGDMNPLHYDAALAATSPFGGLIVQGGVTSGLLNALVAEDLPGPGTVFLQVEWRFVKAVMVGEEITGCYCPGAAAAFRPVGGAQSGAWDRWSGSGAGPSLASSRLRGASGLRQSLRHQPRSGSRRRSSATASSSARRVPPDCC